MKQSTAKDLAQALFEEAGDALFLFDPDTDQLQDVNPMAERLSGFSRPELLGFATTYLFKFGGGNTPRGTGAAAAAGLHQAASRTTVFHAQDGFLLRTRQEGVWVPVNLTITRLHIQPKTMALITARDMRAAYEAHARVQRMEAELRRVLSSVSDCLWSAEWTADACWHFRYISPVVEHLTGRPAPYFQHDLARWQEVIHPQDWECWLQSLRRLRSGQPSQVEYRVVWPDGSVRWLRDSVRVTRSADGGALRLDGVLTDITGRKESERRLAQERQLLRSLIDHLPESIYVKDAEGRYLVDNPAHRQILGVEREEQVLGKTDHDFLPSERAAAYFADEQAVVKSGQPLVDHDELLIDHTGHARWLLTTKVPLFAEGPAGPVVIGLVGISHDITERKCIEAEWQRAKEAAEAANRAKSDFLAKMSHEIRTPMNGIIGMTELALDTQLTGEQRECMQMVLASADSLLTVINDILDFSKIEAGKLQLEPAPFPVRDSLTDAVRTLGLRAQQKGLELLCHVAPGVPDILVGDLGRLRQVLVNLVGNAIKFTEKGEVVVSVSLEGTGQREKPGERGGGVNGSAADPCEACTLHFSVSDTGIGIPPEKHQAIFEPFEQVDGSVSRRFGGTGLGLAISSQLVSLMGGRLEVQSDVGQGSRFHFTARFGLIPGPRGGQPPPPPGLAHLEGAFNGVRVLVVDDNATHRAVLAEMLRSWRMRPTAVASSAAALEELRRAASAGEPYPLLMLDAVMPPPDGWDLAAQLQGQPGLVGATVMMLAPAGRPGGAERCREVGARGALIKPLKQSELLNTILDVLSTPHGQLGGGSNGAGSAGPPAGRPPRARVGPDGKPPDLPALPPLRVLLAEDSHVNQRLAVRILEKQGHSVRVAHNGREAVEAAGREPFDLVLMDVQMPELGGFEATALIREREKGTGRRVPIIALTAHAMKGDRERCLAAGMDGYVAKPILTRELFQAMADVLRALGPPAATTGGGVPPPRAAACAAGSPGGGQALPEGPTEEAVTDFDREAALDRVGGDRTLLRELIEMFETEASNWMAGLSEAIGRGDAATVKRMAHTLKGAVSTFGAARAVEAALRLERMGHEGDLGRAREAWQELQRALDGLRRALNAFRP
jgi:PAS domain S-box-containing protein